MPPGSSNTTNKTYDFYGTPLDYNYTGTTEDRHNKSTHYYVNGLFHRDDGPAEEYWFQDEIPPRDREGYWYQHGKLHRLDGPAINFHSPGEDDDFYINGERLTPSQFYGHPLVFGPKLQFILNTPEE